MWPDNIAHLNISSWRGISPEAVHFYGTFYYGDERDIKVEKILTQKEADTLNAYERMNSPSYLHMDYQKGDTTERFDNWDEIINVVVKMLEKEYPQVDLLFEGSGTSVSCNRPLWGKDKKLVKRLDELFKEADELDFYTYDKNEKRMEELDDEFSKLVGLNYS